MINAVQWGRQRVHILIIRSLAFPQKKQPQVALGTNCFRSKEEEGKERSHWVEVFFFFLSLMLKPTCASLGPGIKSEMTFQSTSHRPCGIHNSNSTFPWEGRFISHPLTLNSCRSLSLFPYNFAHLFFNVSNGSPVVVTFTSSSFTIRTCKETSHAGEAALPEGR